MSKLKPGDIVTVEPWDCEGIERPWGLAFSRGRATKKVKIIPGSLGIVIEQNNILDYEDHYNVMVESKSLSIPVRFLNRDEGACNEAR